VNSLGRQLGRFLIVGGMATGTDALIFGVLVLGGLDARLANLCSYSLSATLAFLLHRFWTFEARGEGVTGQALRFAGMVGAGLAASTAVIWILAPHIGPLPAKTMAIGVTVVLNFTVSRWLVFANRPVMGA